MNEDPRNATPSSMFVIHLDRDLEDRDAEKPEGVRDVADDREDVEHSGNTSQLVIFLVF